MFSKLKITFLIMVLLQTGLMAQFSITGKITDSSNGKTLPGASVMLNNTFKATASNASGKYILSKVDKGKYVLKVSFIGYQTFESKINLDTDLNIDIVLEPMVYMSDEIIVRASRDNSSSNNTKTQISQADIKNRNTGQDLPYLLSMTPSVVLTSDAGAGIGYTGMRIRGSDLSRINVTLNGVPVNDGESQAVFFVDLPDLASSIDNVQIQRGVGSSTNGAAAFGASINIKTDKFYCEPYA
jgi:iron complex outermembrane receptor protein